MKRIISYTKFDTNAHQQASPLSWIRCLTRWSKEDIIQVLSWGRMHRSRGILWIFCWSVNLFCKDKHCNLLVSKLSTPIRRPKLLVRVQEVILQGKGRPQRQISGFPWFFWIACNKCESLKCTDGWARRVSPSCIFHLLLSIQTLTLHQLQWMVGQTRFLKNNLRAAMGWSSFH